MVWVKALHVQWLLCKLRQWYLIPTHRWIAILLTESLTTETSSRKLLTILTTALLTTCSWRALGSLAVVGTS